MTSLEAYLDQACTRLPTNPAAAEDIREELRGHICEVIDAYLAEGLNRRAATARALSEFGAAPRVRHFLERVHRGDPWWTWRIKGMVLGSLLGGLLSLPLLVSGHFAEASRVFLPLSAWHFSAAQFLANGMLAGGLIGLLAGARGLFVGWVVGALIWLAEHIACFIVLTASGVAASDGGLQLFNFVLLSPVLGGLFGALVGAGCSAILSAASRLRPEIR